MNPLSKGNVQIMNRWTLWAKAMYTIWTDKPFEQRQGTQYEQMNLLSKSKVQNMNRWTLWAKARYKIWTDEPFEQRQGTNYEQMNPFEQRQGNQSPFARSEPDEGKSNLLIIGLCVAVISVAAVICGPLLVDLGFTKTMLTIVVSVVSGRIGGQVLLHNIKKWSVQVVHKHHYRVQLTSFHHKQVYLFAMTVLTP